MLQLLDGDLPERCGLSHRQIVELGNRVSVLVDEYGTACSESTRLILAKLNTFLEVTHHFRPQSCKERDEACSRVGHSLRQESERHRSPVGGVLVQVAGNSGVVSVLGMAGLIGIAAGTATTAGLLHDYRASVAVASSRSIVPRGVVFVNLHALPFSYITPLSLITRGPCSPSPHSPLFVCLVCPISSQPASPCSCSSSSRCSACPSRTPFRSVSAGRSRTSLSSAGLLGAAASGRCSAWHTGSQVGR